MSRLIDADALIESLLYDVELDEKMLNDTDFVGSSRELVQFDKDCKQNAIDFLRDAPTITELISCRDCKYFQVTDNDECRYCKIWFAKEEHFMPENYYCADAERKVVK